MNSGFDLSSYTIHHIANTTEWHLPFLPAIPLPQWLGVHGLMLLIGAGILITLFCVVYRKNDPVPTGWTNALEAFVVFVRDDIAIANLGEEDGRKFTPLFCGYFSFILILNLMGLIPVFSTATANINVTAALALITFSFMTVGAIKKNGIGGFVKAFIPSGVPWPILLLLVPLEFLGLFIKTFALTVRLFANMLAGHIVIVSFLGTVVLLGAFGSPMAVLALLIYMLEVLVAFLQAYVFTLLSAIFIGQMYYPEH
jgi:F-type H+-transporting ATPase subunit a